MLKLLKTIWHLPRRALMLLIKLYQHTLSPDHGILKYAKPFGTCKFHPTCSEYFYEAVKKYGVVKGGFKGLYRICRCNPFSEGGVDRVE